jgi:hypothetical protein
MWEINYSFIYYKKLGVKYFQFINHVFEFFFQ